MLKKVFLAGAAGIALASAPVIAQDDSGNGTANVIAFALIAGIAAIAVLAFVDDDDDNEDAPVSP